MLSYLIKSNEETWQTLTHGGAPAWVHIYANIWSADGIKYKQAPFYAEIRLYFWFLK